LSGGVSCQQAHADEQLLTDAQEEVLENWVKIQGCCGIPMTYASVAQAAAEISGKQVGESWPKQFKKHHHYLKIKKTTPLEKA